jgi:hypothetical protein
VEADLLDSRIAAKCSFARFCAFDSSLSAWILARAAAQLQRRLLLVANEKRGKVSGAYGTWKGLDSNVFSVQGRAERCDSCK